MIHYLKHPGAILLVFRRFWERKKPAIDSGIVRWALKNPRRSSFYYFLFSKRFDREHYGVLHGKYLHLSQEAGSMSDEATLRRSLHMIEKGLITIPQKPVFAEGYILNTVRILERFLLNKKDLNTHKWAFDVLGRYFSTVRPTDVVREASALFDRIIIKFPLFTATGNEFAPYSRSSVTLSSIGFEDFFNLCQQRRSVRWYQDKPVPHDLVDKAVASALTAPSACNRQPFRFIFVENKERLKRVVTFPMGCDTFGHNVKLMAILIGDQSNYFDERDRHLIYIDGGLAAMTFMMSLETLGLSSCPINWPDIEEREKMLADEFRLAPSEKCIMFISIGFALDEGGIPYSSKKHVENVITRY